MRPILRLAAVATLSTACGTAVAADAAQPGLWEYTVKTEMAGMPFEMPAVSTKQCLKPEDAKQGAVFTEDKSGCRLENLRQSGGRTSYDVICSGDEPTRVHYDIKVTPTTMEGHGTIEMEDGQTMKQKLTARRLGPCD